MPLRCCTPPPVCHSAAVLRRRPSLLQPHAAAAATIVIAVSRWPPPRHRHVHVHVADGDSHIASARTSLAPSPPRLPGGCHRYRCHCRRNHIAAAPIVAAAVNASLLPSSLLTQPQMYHTYAPPLPSPLCARLLRQHVAQTPKAAPRPQLRHPHLLSGPGGFWCSRLDAPASPVLLGSCRTQPVDVSPCSPRRWT